MGQAQAITERLEGITADFIARSPLFAFWREGAVGAGEAARFLASFDALVKSFPSLIAQGAARAQDEGTRVALAVNLYQESGEGDLDRTHHAIYRRFLATAGVPLQGLSDGRAAVQWRERLSAYLREAPPGAALGALAAGEFLAQPALSRLYPVLKGHFPNADQEYFTHHLALEVEHVEEIAQAIVRQAGIDGGTGRVEEGFRYALSVWGDYFDSLLSELKPA